MRLREQYLLAYNIVQAIGWSGILLKTVIGLREGLSWPELYVNVETLVQVFQSAAVLEIVHSAAGLVRSPLSTTIIQVFSRVSVIWLILNKVEMGRESVGVPLLLIAWSITEVIRYAFYATNLLGQVPSSLMWCRYTLFIVLYPMGASGEILTVLSALPEVHAKKHLTLEMPNFLNVSFSFWWYLVFFVITYLPGFSQNVLSYVRSTP